jgi:hypothetical protein
MNCKIQKEYQTVRAKIVLSKSLVKCYDKGDWIAPLAGVPVR